MSNKLNLKDISEVKLALIKDKKIIFKNFEDFNIYLVNHNIKITILEYIKCIHLYLFKHVDINLFTDFLNYCYDDQLFNISESDLVKYNLIDNILESSLDKFIKKYNLILDTDYRIRKINKNKVIIKDNLEKLANTNSPIIKNKEYKFTSRMLKRCLFKIDTKYIDYYLLIENCILHYTNYQTNLFNKLGFIRDIKLDNIIKNYQFQSNQMNMLYDHLLSLSNKNNLMNQNINIAYKKMNDIIYQFHLKEHDLELQTNKNSKFKKILNTFALYQISKNKLYYIDCNSKIFSMVEKISNLEYENQFELIYNKEYNIKYINVLAKLMNNFKNDLEFNQSEITLLNNLENNNIINYLNDEFSKFN